MGYEYVLIDNWWDTNIGRERMKDFIDYAHSEKCRCNFYGIVPAATGMI